MIPGQLVLNVGRYRDLQCPMVGKPIDRPVIMALIQMVNMKKRMKAAHDKSRCWKECLYCERSQGMR